MGIRTATKTSGGGEVVLGGGRSSGEPGEATTVSGSWSLAPEACLRARGSSAVPLSLEPPAGFPRRAAARFFRTHVLREWGGGACLGSLRPVAQLVLCSPSLTLLSLWTPSLVPGRPGVLFSSLQTGGQRRTSPTTDGVDPCAGEDNPPGTPGGGALTTPPHPAVARLRAALLLPQTPAPTTPPAARAT